MAYVKENNTNSSNSISRDGILSQNSLVRMSL